MRYFVTLAGRTLEVDLSGGTPTVDGVPVDAELASRPGTSTRHLRVDGASHALLAHPEGGAGRWSVALGGERFAVEVLDERMRAIRALGGAGDAAAERTVVAPMPGLVVRVEVRPGEAVRAGQGVVIVEAMKMENELKAPADGVVARVEVVAGQTVEKGAVLLVLE